MCSRHLSVLFREKRLEKLLCRLLVMEANHRAASPPLPKRGRNFLQATQELAILQALEHRTCQVQ